MSRRVVAIDISDYHFESVAQLVFLELDRQNFHHKLQNFAALCVEQDSKKPVNEEANLFSNNDNLGDRFIVKLSARSMLNAFFAVCVALIAAYGVARFLSLKMRTHASYTDLRALAKSYLSFSQQHDTSDRSQSFSEGDKAQQCLTCVNFR